MARIALFGASRGLGRALVEHIRDVQPQTVFFLNARKKADLERVSRGEDWILPVDLTSPDALKEVVSALHEFHPQQIFYVAGGGPYGLFEEKSWEDHLWAIRLNFLFPAELLHMLMRESQDASPGYPEDQRLQQFIIIGSAIAGQNPDPKASSYAASKHAARGLVTSIQKERKAKEGKGLDVRLYKPGYMDTDMLPPQAWPRQQGLVKSVTDEARQIWQWCQSPLE